MPLGPLRIHTQKIKEYSHFKTVPFFLHAEHTHRPKSREELLIPPKQMFAGGNLRAPLISAAIW